MSERQAQRVRLERTDLAQADFEARAEKERGTQYADGGLGAYDKVCYPDPVKVAACHDEWYWENGAPSDWRLGGGWHAGV